MSIGDLVHTAEVRAALAAHDAGAAYRLLIAGGVTQREIAAATGQKQSEVSDIRAGRRVCSVWVLERIADGLGVPRGLMGLGYGPEGAYHEVTEPPGSEEMAEAVKRRNFINAVAGTVVWGHPVIRELLVAPDARVTPLPRSLGAHDVSALRAVTEQMRLLARQYGGQADTIGAAAQRYGRLLTVPGTDAVKNDLCSALSELHTVAGWACHDVMSPDAARAHLATAMNLAIEAGDSYRAVDALYHAGMTMQLPAPHDALKCYQIAQARLGSEIGAYPRAATLAACLHGQIARACGALGRPEDARRALGSARSHYGAEAFDRADMDWLTAELETDLGQLDVAEPFAVASVRTWEGVEDRRQAALAGITFARIHVWTGEPDGVRLAAKAIDDVATLQSKRARARLTPLGNALTARRKDSTAQDLARRVRQLAMP